MENNARFLNAVVGWARGVLTRALELEGGDPEHYQKLFDRARDEPGIPYFELSRRFELAPVDSQIACLCLAQQIDETTGRLLARLHGDPSQRHVTADAACRLFLEGDFELGCYVLQALGSRSALISHRVIERLELDPGAPAMRRPVRLTQAAAELLLGFEPEAAPYFELLAAAPDTNGRAVVGDEVRERLVGALADYSRAVLCHAPAFRRADRLPPPVVLLFGPEGAGKSMLALEVAREAFDAVVHVDCTSLADGDHRPWRAILRRAIDAAALRAAAVVFEDVHHLFRPGPAARAVRAMLLDTPVTAIMTSRDTDLDSKLAELLLLSIEVEAPGPALREKIWDGALGERRAADFDLGVLSQRYRWSGRRIAAAARLARSRSLAAEPEHELGMDGVDAVARLMLETQMGGLARRLGGGFTLDDIVLPDDQIRQLRDIVDAGHSWDTVMSTWGFANRLPSGRSLTALFWGEPGTGKSFAARIIAHHLGKRLFAVNLDQILSKWLGETEKNIHEIFTAASGTGAVLLFDEADSLFASRIEANTAQDRSNNMITSLLLQEIDEYAGVVILTTNRKEHFDDAFERRMLFSVKFPMPERDQRQAIWATLLPPETPTADDIDLEDLAGRFELAGGDIKKCLVRAAMSAHASGSELDQGLLLQTCIDEYTQSGRLVPP